MVEETVNRLDWNFATSFITQFLILSVQLSLNFLNKSLLNLLYRDYYSQGWARRVGWVRFGGKYKKPFFGRN